MEQLIPVINWLKTNRFWLLSGLLAVAMLAMWFVATKSVTDLTARNKSEITSKLASGDSINKITLVEGKRAHPNLKTQEGMNGEITATIDSIMKAWELRYAAQKDVFKWPSVLSKDFTREFDKYSPPETFPIDKDYTRGLAHLLEPYKDQIDGSMTEICDVIETRWFEDDIKTASTSGPTGGEPGGGQGGRPDSEISADLDNSVVVKWNEDNQTLWKAKLTSYKNRDDNNNNDLPTPLQVYMLQQDLSLLRAMFTIIATVNQDEDGNQIDAHDFARIKRIDHVAFGRDLDPLTGELEAVEARLAGGGTIKKTGKSDGPTPPSSAGRGRRGGSQVSETDPFDYSSDPSPFHGRYVDATYTRIPAETVRQILKDGKDDPKNMELIVAKRVPVRIAMRMDERFVDDFIAASANSPVIFEISQVRVNKHEPMEGIKLGGSEGNFADLADAGDSRVDELGASTGSLDDGTAGSSATSGSDELGPVETRTHYDVTVEFYGIVKIYNPPNRERLEPAKPDAANP